MALRPRVTLRLTLTAFSLIAALRAQGATLFVDADLSTGTNNGGDWSDAFQGPHGLQAALGTALPGDEIWVARGTYLPTDDGDRDVSFNLGPNIALFGGFVGNESASVERDPVNNTTVLSGDLMGDDASNFSNRSDNTRHVVRLVDSLVTIDGFTIRGGNASGLRGVDCSMMVQVS